MVTERERLKDIMIKMARGRDCGHKLKFNIDNKRVEPVSGGGSSIDYYPDPDDALKINKSDADLYGDHTHINGRIVLAAEALKDLEKDMPHKVYFSGNPGEQVYQYLGEGGVHSSFPGRITAVESMNDEQSAELDFKNDKIQVRVKWDDLKNPEATAKAIKANAQGFIKIDNERHRAPVEIIPIRTELFSRFGGLLETDALADARVAIFGLGSGGSHTAIELAKSGIGCFDLIDHDRLEVGNIARHLCDLADIGRLKVNAMADAIKRKNPYAEVRCWPVKAEEDQLETIAGIIRNAELVYAATDSHKSKLLINKVCVQEGTTCIFAGAHRRAHGGQVLRVRPYKSVCFQCFAMLLPEQVQDQEISSADQAAELAYTDRPVPIEPGLSTDIAPISLMATKVGIQELLQNKQTTLRSLDQDLEADWYLWLNRREAGTQYENLKPLGFSVDGMHILRWYGIEIHRHEACPECGNFVENFSDKAIGEMLNSVRAVGSELA